MVLSFIIYSYVFIAITVKNTQTIPDYGQNARAPRMDSQSDFFFFYNHQNSIRKLAMKLVELKLSRMNILLASRVPVI